jgi:hypothetical protein
VVDGADYALWQKSPDAYSGAAGYNSWRANYGRTLAGGGSAADASAVPEPAGMVLIAAVLIGLRRTGRRRYSRSLLESGMRD